MEEKQEERKPLLQRILLTSSDSSSSLPSKNNSIENNPPTTRRPDNRNENEERPPSQSNSEDDGFLENLVELVPKKDKLLKKLRKLSKASTLVLRVGYVIAVVSILGWGGVLAVIEAYAGDGDIAVGQSAMMGSSVFVLNRRRKRAERILNRFHNFLNDPMLEDDLFDIAAESLKALAEQLLDTAALLVAAWLLPHVLKLTKEFVDELGIKSAGIKVFVYIVIFLVGIVILSLILILYAMLQELIMVRIDKVVDQVDDMPQFDFLDRFDDDEDTLDSASEQSAESMFSIVDLPNTTDIHPKHSLERPLAQSLTRKSYHSFR